MADQAYYETLSQGVQVWNAWREAEEQEDEGCANVDAEHGGVAQGLRDGRWQR